MSDEQSLENIARLYTKTERQNFSREQIIDMLVGPSVAGDERVDTESLQNIRENLIEATVPVFVRALDAIIEGKVLDSDSLLPSLSEESKNLLKILNVEQATELKKLFSEYE